MTRSGDTADIVRPTFGGKTRVEAGLSPKASIIAEAVGSSRVQLRLPLSTLEQTERDLVLLETAVKESLATVRRSMRSKDVGALLAVRSVLEHTNRRLNVYHKGR